MMEQQEQIRSFLAAVRRRWFADETLRVVGRASAAAAIPAFAGLSLYWILAPGGVPLVLLSTATGALSVAAATLVALRMQRRPDDRHVARFVEERAALLTNATPFDDALVTAMESSVGGDAAFRPLLVSAAVRKLQNTEPSQIVPATRLRRAAAQAIGGLATLAVALVFALPPLERAIETGWIMFFPNAIQVEVLPGDRRVVAGQPLEIRAVIRTRDGVLTRLNPVLTVAAGAEHRAVAMTPDGEGFTFPFESVDRTFKYKVSVGNATSREFTITALYAPRVERIELRYQYPAFTGLRPRDEDDSGDIYGPAGTSVRVRVHTDKPVMSGEMTFSGSPTRAFSIVGDRVLEGQIVLARDDSYRVKLADGDGLRASGDTEYFIRLMDDRPPDVRILRPAGDQQITPLEEVSIEARAEDDYGISALELVYFVPGGPARAVPFGRTSGTDVVRLGAHLLAAEELRVKPGDVITYYARARDVGRGKRSTETRSDMYFLEVRPFGEEFVAAESQAGGGASSQQIESLIAAQKEIISATWNIERRSGAGKSAADVQAVAQAQAELKARAEQMTSRRGRGRFDMPQQVLPPQPRPARQPTGDPVSSAIQAMGRAVEQLQGDRTKDALPHEMTALHGLLQAQAEIRRREVVQQQANGASTGGTGRQGEDLSALFDKELQRQQRTNYETRSQIEERPDQKDQDSALDRIRDLARRQEEISRRLREIAESTISPEERKRELERLTREQMELREQVEELARRAGEQGGQKQSQSQQKSSGQQSQQPSQGSQSERQGAGAAGEMKDAAERMRGAAADLRRDDPKAAADQAAQAAERLRELEQQMRADSPESRRRAAGELQLEAQQIAEEQRRIAAEAGRLERGQGTGNSDARRRLAGEKDRLAERVDALQRGASELARGEQAEPLGNAARELDREQIGRRMRDTARQMRDGAGTAATEEKIAQALERVVQQIGEQGAESRESSGQLDQTRAIRNRLDRLERQMADAEAKQQAETGRQSGADQPGSQRGSGRAGQDSGGAPGASDAELQRLRQEYARELQQARESLSQMQPSAPRSGAAGTTPEKHEWSQADPGTQGFKQDFSGWQSLRKDIDLALERTEAAASARLAREAARDRLSAGGSDRVPDAYRKLIARYYESLARQKK
jgi:hypothetical protein